MTTIAQQLKIKEFPFQIKDSNGNLIYWEDQDGYWSKTEFESNGNLIYCEDSDGYILDLRPKTVELTMDEIAKKFGIDVNNLKIKK
jgi:hypothetical protein